MKFAMAELVTPNGDLIYVNPFFVQAILPHGDNDTTLKIKGVRQQFVRGTPTEIYNKIIADLNGENKQKEIEATYDDPNM